MKIDNFKGFLEFKNESFPFSFSNYYFTYVPIYIGNRFINFIGQI